MIFTPVREAYFLCPALRHDPELKAAFKSSEEDNPVGVIYFMTPHSRLNSKEEKKEHKRLYEVAIRLNLNAQWLKAKDFRTAFSRPYPSIIVFASYVSVEYKRFVLFAESASPSPAEEVMLYDSYYFESKVAFKRRAPHRASEVGKNNAMYSMKIVLAGFEGEEEQDLVRKINEMGGLVQDISTDLSTIDYIVANTGMEQLALEGNKSLISVMKKAWVLDVYRDNDNVDQDEIAGNDERYLHHLFPLFKVCSDPMAENQILVKSEARFVSGEHDRSRVVVKLENQLWEMNDDA